VFRDVYRPASQRRCWILLGAFGLVLLGVGIGLRDPWPADEPRFALIAKEMLATGQFLIPHRGGELYPDKPPVFIWLSALAIWLTGSVRLGFLWPSLLASLATLGLVCDLVRRLYGARIALMTGASLLATVQFVMQAKAAQIDMVLTFFTTLGAYGLLRHALLGPSRLWWLLGWGAVGLGIITKGVGFLPLLFLPAWFWLAARGRVPRLALQDLALGLLVMTGTLALWGIPMLAAASLSGDPALASYRDNILLRQTGERYAASWHHLNPWYYYLVEVIPWAWMPLVLALPWAIPAWWRRMRRGDARVTLPLTGVLLTLIFFSLSPGKRGVYILPTIPLLAVALAPLLPGLLKKRGLQWAGGGVLAAAGSALLVLGLLGLAGIDSLENAVRRYGLDPWPLCTALGLAAIVLLIRMRVDRGMFALVLWLPALWTAWSTWGYYHLDRLRSPNHLMERVADITGSGAWLAMPSAQEEFLLQARQPSVHFGRDTLGPAQLSRAFDWFAKAPNERWMLIEQKRKDEIGCADMGAARDLGYQNGDDWWLIPGSAFTACKGSVDAAPLFIAPTTTGSALIGRG